MKSKVFALDVQALKKTFEGKKPVTAVAGIAFQVREAEVIGLLGPNGAGKSTTIQMLLGTLTPSSGAICYFGRDFSLERKRVLEDVGYVNGYGRLPWNLTVMENLMVFARLAGVSRAVCRKRIMHLLDSFAVGDLRGKLFAELSAGQATRVMLAKAFLGEPKIVLLDEPTAALDPDICVEVRRFIKEQRKHSGVSMVYTSHNMAEVSELCDRVIFMSQGHIVAEGSPADLARACASTRVRLLAPQSTEEQLGRLGAQRDGPWIEIEADGHEVAPVVERVVREKIRFVDLEIRRPTLEDFFLKVSVNGRISNGRGTKEGYEIT